MRVIAVAVNIPLKNMLLDFVFFPFFFFSLSLSHTQAHHIDSINDHIRRIQHVVCQKVDSPSTRRQAFGQSICIDG